MGIGGIGSAYGVGSIYPSYVYNPNTVSAKSMDKLSRISDDVLDEKIDYSEMEAEENRNPLKKGQTIDFEGIVAKQMQQGRNRAARLMPEGLAPEKENAGAEVVQMPERGEEAVDAVKTSDTEDMAADADAGNENNAPSMQMGTPSLMERAIHAYEMFMTA